MLTRPLQLLLCPLSSSCLAISLPGLPLERAPLWGGSCHSERFAMCAALLVTLPSSCSWVILATPRVLREVSPYALRFRLDGCAMLSPCMIVDIRVTTTYM